MVKSINKNSKKSKVSTTKVEKKIKDKKEKNVSLNDKNLNFNLIDFIKNNYNYILFGIICLIFIFNTFPKIDNQIIKQNSDPIGYFNSAVHLIEGKINSIDNYTSPGYPILLSIFFKIFSPSVYLAELISFIFGLGLLIVLYLFVKKLTNNEVISLLVSIIYSMDWFVIFYSTNVYKEIIFVFFIILFLYLALINVEKEKIWIYFIQGLIIGFIVYLNSWVYVLTILLGYPLLINYKKISKKFLLNFFKKSSMYLVGLFLMLFLINIFFMIPQAGHSSFFLTNGGILLYLGNNPSSESNVAFTSQYTDVSWIPLDKYYGIKNLHKNISRDELSSMSTKFVLNFWLNNPSFLLNRELEFNFKYWLFPNLDWAQLWLNNKSELMSYLWIKWIFEAIGLIYLMTRGKKHILKYSIIYLPIIIIWSIYSLAPYLLRYKFYVHPFNIIIASIGFYVVFNTLYSIFKKEIKNVK